MDTHRLGYFLCVAEEGSINRAATVLGIAQPALSRQLRLLEKELGVNLLRRTTRGVQLTEDGEQLRATIASPLRQLELAIRYVGSPLAKVERGLRIGLPETAACVLSIPLLDILSTAFPKVDLHLRVASTDDLIQGLLKATVDIALIDPTPDERIFRAGLLEEELVLVGGPASKLHKDQPITFAELIQRPLILPVSRLGVRSSLERTALRLKLKLLSHVATDSLHVTKDLVEAGRGYAVLPVSACAAELRTARLRCAPLRDPPIVQQLGIAVADKLELSRGFSTRVSQIIRKEAAGLIKSKVWKARLIHPDRRATNG